MPEIKQLAVTIIIQRWFDVYPNLPHFKGMS